MFLAFSQKIKLGKQRLTIYSGCYGSKGEKNILLKVIKRVKVKRVKVKQ